MKRLFALLMLTLLSFAAFAQENVCNVPPPVKWVYYTDLSVVGGPYQCMPAPGGPGVGLTVRTNTAGVMTYWYCKGADGKYTANFGAATWARLMTNELKPDTAMSDPSLTAIWCPFQAEMNANVPAAATDPVWKVATNGGTATRPTYAFANGVRAKRCTAPIRASLWVVCATSA